MKNYHKLVSIVLHICHVIILFPLVSHRHKLWLNEWVSACSFTSITIKQQSRGYQWPKPAQVQWDLFKTISTLRAFCCCCCWYISRSIGRQQQQRRTILLHFCQAAHACIPPCHRYFNIISVFACLTKTYHSPRLRDDAMMMSAIVSITGWSAPLYTNRLL